MLDISPKKHLGQNFLTDPNITRKILAACSLTRDDCVLEIGPGLGALTKELVARTRRVIAIETDGRLCGKLRAQIPDETLDVIHADFLKYDLAFLPLNLKVVGNLPYNIASGIIARILNAGVHFRFLFITVQLEFGRRMLAKPNTKDYSAFSCFVQYFTLGTLLCLVLRLHNFALQSYELMSQYVAWVSHANYL